MSKTQDLVVISDIHFHDWRAFATGSGFRNSRLNQTCKVVRESLQYARNNSCPWLCAGDFFHTISFTDNAVRSRAWATFLQFQDVEKYVVWGDHDTRGKGNSRVQEADAAITEWEHSLENFHILNGQTVELPGGISLYGAGAQPKPEFVNFGPGGDIGLFHVLVSGSETPSGFELRSTVEGYDLGNYHLAICGDVHHPQQGWKTDEGPAVLIPGAPEHHNFGDKGQRGWWVVEMEEREDGWWPRDLTLHPSDSPKFLSVESKEEVQDDGNFYRITGEEVREEDLPEGSTVVSSPPTTVEARDLFSQGSSVEEILQTWLREQDVPEDEWGEYKDLAAELLGASGDIRQLRDCRLRWIEVENFLSFESARLELEEGVTLILGDSRDFDSNGAGKSTLIVEAPYWGIFGKTARDIPADEVISWWAKECRVSMGIEFRDGTLLKVERTRKRDQSPDLVVTEDGEPMEGSGVRELTDRLTHRLGLTDDIYRALACYNQEDLLLLSRSTDSERKELIADLCGLGTYQKASTGAGRKATDLADETQKLGTRVETWQESLEEAKRDRASAEDRAETWAEAHTRDLHSARKELKTLEESTRVEDEEARLERIRERGEALVARKGHKVFACEEQLTAEIRDRQTSDLQDKIEGVRDSLALPDLGEEEVHVALKKWREKKLVADQDVEILEADEEEAQAEVARATTRFSYARNRLVEAGGLEPGETCPECGQEVGADHIESMVEEAQSKMDSYATEAKKAKESLREAREALESAEEAQERAEEKVDMLEKEVGRRERLADLESSLETAGKQAGSLAHKELEAEVQKYEAHIESWITRAENIVDRVRDSHARDVEQARKEVERLESESNPHIETAQKEAKRVEKLEGKIGEAEDKLETLARQRDIAEFWNDGFSKQGIQSLLLEEIAAEFNKARRDVFPILTHGVYDVQFSTQSRTQGGELREKTEFLVRYHGKDVHYGALSGGQKRRVDVGVMLTLILANARTRNVPGVLGMIVLDETFDFLDGDGAESLADTLQQVVETVPSIYVVTQNPELASNFPTTLLVEQDDEGVSRVAA